MSYYPTREPDMPSVRDGERVRGPKLEVRCEDCDWVGPRLGTPANPHCCVEGHALLTGHSRFIPYVPGRRRDAPTVNSCGAGGLPMKHAEPEDVPVASTEGEDVTANEMACRDMMARRERADPREPAHPPSSQADGHADARCHHCGKPCPDGRTSHESCDGFRAWIDRGGTLD